MSRFCAGACRLLITCTLLISTADAQRASGSISGTVLDSDGRRVLEAAVTLNSAATGRVWHTRGNELGVYRFAGLEPGTYELKANFQELTSGTITGVTLDVAQELILDLTLKMGLTSQDVSVYADTPVTDVGSMTLSRVITGPEATELPLNGRDLTQLALLVPGVLESRGSTRDINVGFGKKISISGSRPNQNLFTIDGTDSGDSLNNTPAGANGQLTGVETIREFRVATNTLSAEYGRAAGGVINIVTRSGSNDLNGSIFYFHRNDNLDARSFFDTAKPEFRRHQFGGSAGFPLVKDRTFVFGSYEGLRESRGVTQLAYVPDKEVLQAAAGDSIFFPAADRSVNLSSTVAPLLRLYPLPTGPEVVPGSHIAEYRGILDRRANEDFANFRVDHVLSESDALFGRYLYSGSTYVLPVLYPDYPNLATNARHLFTVAETHSGSSGSVNEFLLGFNRSAPEEQVPQPPSDRNIPFIAGRELGSLRVTAGSGLPALTEVGTDRTDPKSFHNQTLQVSDNLSLVRSNHTLKVGLLFERFHYDGLSESRTRGRLEFRNLIDMLGDEPRRIEGASARSDFERRFRQSLFGAYLQDDFRVSPTLTLFGGVRWEFVTTPREVEGRVSNLTDYLDPEAVLVVAEERYADPQAALPRVCCRELFDNPTLGNVSPRVGFAWDFLGTRMTVLRGGFGIFHDQPLFHIYRSQVFRSLPFVETTYLNAGEWPGGATVASLPLDPSLFSSPSGAQDTEAIQYGLRSSYVMQYNLNLQRALGRLASLSVAYVGSRGVNLFGRADTNLALRETLPDGTIYFPSNERQNSNFGSVRTLFQGINSWYNSLQVQFGRRFERGIGFWSSYTFSRCLDEASGTGGRQEQQFGQTRPLDPFDLARDKGLCDYNVQQNFVLSHLVSLPFGNGLSGISRVLLADWNLNGILHLASGIPFTPSIEGDPDNDGSEDNGARPNLVGDPMSGSCPLGGQVGTADCWFNPSAFAFPGKGFRGNLGRNTLIGPGLASYDMALSKRLPLAGEFQLEVRLEAFNLFNHTNLNPPSNSEDGSQIFSEDGTLDPTGAIIRARSGTSTGPRELQFGLRLIF